MKGLPNLDLLRSIAVMLVVVEHTLLAMHVRRVGNWDLQWLGVVGVFMFFVHTSLVLMWSLDRNSSFSGFLIRRIFRIYPLAIAAIAVVVLFHVPTMHNPEGDTYFNLPSARDLIANLLLLQTSILGVMWTLPIEMEMYLFLPFLHFLIRRRGALYAVLLIWIAVTEFDIRFVPLNYSGFFNQIPCFLAGVIAFGMFPRVRPRLPSVMLPVLIAGLLACFLSRPSWRNSWLLTLVLGTTLPLFRQIEAKWLVRTCHHVAKYSYGIYLVHPLSVTIGVYVLRDFNIVLRIAAILVSLALMAILAYYFLEKPMIDLGGKLTAPNKSQIQESMSA